MVAVTEGRRRSRVSFVKAKQETGKTTLPRSRLMDSEQWPENGLIVTAMDRSGGGKYGSSITKERIAINALKIRALLLNAA